MPIIKVTNQAEWDALPKAFSEFTEVHIHSTDWITIKGCPESSRVEARESSSVVAWGSSSVVARESSSVHNYSPHSNVLLWSYAVAWLFNKAKAVKKSETATVITPIIEKGIDAWLEREGIEKAANILLFKRVSKDNGFPCSSFIGVK